MMSAAPHVVILSGSLSPTSRADLIAGWCARQAAELGATTSLFRGVDLEFPFYRPGLADTQRAVRHYLDALAGSDGVVLVSPAYHGTISGLLKNALDYVNELAGLTAPYLDGRAIGCVAVAAGEQGASSTLATLRTVSHALRGWPTPLGVALAGERAALDQRGEPAARATLGQLAEMLRQVLAPAVGQTARRRELVSSTGPAVA
jgi:NAD(P)H-dependent FMN reductase